MKIMDSISRWILKRASATVNPEKWFVDFFGGQPSKSGVVVTNDSSMQIATYFACVRNISEDVAKLPLIPYKPLSPQGKERLKDHSLYKILHDEANSEMSAMTLRETLTAHALNWGNGYAYIEKKRFNEVTGLWPLRPDRVKVERGSDNVIYYEVTQDDGHKIKFNYKEILHIHGLGYDGMVGYNVARYGRECFGSIVAAEQHGATFFKNGSISNGILEIPSALSDKAKANLKDSFQKEYGGSDGANKMIVLEEGVKFNKTSIPPEEAQFLETRQFSVPEICRWFRMQPNKVADTTRAQGWSTLEQTNTDYVIDTLMPWFVRWGQEIARKLFTTEEKQRGYFVKHLVDALLRGDIDKRYAAYAVGRQWGWLSVDDIREKEEMNPLPDDKGKDYLVPLNMIPAGEKPPEPQPYNQPEPQKEKEDDSKAVNVSVVNNMPQEKTVEDNFIAITFIDNIANRLFSAEISELEKHIAKADEDRGKFNQWLDDYYIKHEKHCTQAIGSHPQIKNSFETAKEFIQFSRFGLKADDKPLEVFETFKTNQIEKNKGFLREKLH